MRLLLIEDDLPLADALQRALRAEGFAVDHLASGKQAVLALESGEADAVILDLGLPDMDGLDVLKRVRERRIATPILILTARDSTLDKIKGLDVGADDYLVKPFDVSELLARIRVISRRLGTMPDTQIQLGPVTLDTLGHRLLVQGEQVTLSRREYMLAKALMENAGRIQSRQQLETRLYEWGEEVASNAVEVHIHHLRKKLPEGFIHTVRGVGYTVNK
ncbi:response regulator [Bowmanella dokdonensis]|uniref:Response regulator transcription factor n=1 Tax=Bowmanella dokdonensis TaxID=751969 RepID=A0A939DQJ7_9ALTE|nr:response regulator transcription factor [Bowmanella dokdonensis]MBN7826838.1 response regulator transcription factor [Bowmanella dokdonensis]